MKQLFCGCLLLGVMMTACTNNEKSNETIDTLQDTMMPASVQPVPDNTETMKDSTERRSDSLNGRDSGR
ncbi:MAG: hypothetical protein EOO06_18290 [Chitinophagaceae bacterium]|nr:MAG: hypothetical protein EOO06_18290 [Chitinophagaceae bacterium]